MLGTYIATSPELGSGDGLTQRPQAATRLPQVDFFLVQHNLDFLLPQGVTLRTSGHVLSLAAMFLRQVSYHYFEVSLYVPYAQAGQQPSL